MATKTTTPILLEYKEDGKIVVVKFIDGRKYRLQHPGNRTYLEWQKEFFSLTDGIDQTKFLDKAFEYVVIPVEHEFQPTIDDIKPREVGVWTALLRRFCDGSLDNTVAGYKEEPNKRGNQNRAGKGDSSGVDVLASDSV